MNRYLALAEYDACGSWVGKVDPEWPGDWVLVVLTWEVDRPGSPGKKNVHQNVMLTYREDEMLLPEQWELVAMEGITGILDDPVTWDMLHVVEIPEGFDFMTVHLMLQHRDVTQDIGWLYEKFHSLREDWEGYIRYIKRQ